ncbi:trypsin-like serine protease [Corynebacterium sp.]|uniref:trypsin-like serine protease n=1 Tax=Corynebacterium sp. TaxID=1720 RepID=UPI0026E09563|nr:trypsin-like serine protease [Corynebacterium sp.]MDO5511421.1 trypsin-like serine protease [Corynebacterium sp.]
MKTPAWASLAAVTALGVGAVIGWSVEEQRQHPTPIAEIIAAAPAQVEAAYRAPASSPWAPGTSVMITKTLPVPGETIQVGQCTVAYSFTAGERAFAVTASHCGTPGDHVWPTSDGAAADFAAPVGQFLYSDLYDEQSSRLDVGVIEITNPFFAMPLPEQTFPTVVAEFVGELPETICKYGMTTGETCGEPINQTGIEILADHNGVELRAVAATAAVCARAGDSGGPVYADIDGRRVIVGLVSGTRDAARDISCDDPTTGPMTMSYTSMPAIQSVVDRVVPEAEYQ